jgi:hypothetical protein
MALPGRNEKTSPNNWLLFFHIGQRAFGIEGANAAVLGEFGTLKPPEGIMFSSTASRLKFIPSDASYTKLSIAYNPSRSPG